MTSRVVSYAIELHERADGTVFCTVTRIVRAEDGSFTFPELARFEVESQERVRDADKRSAMMRGSAARWAMLVTRSARRRGALGAV